MTIVNYIMELIVYFRTGYRVRSHSSNRQFRNAVLISWLRESEVQEKSPGKRRVVGHYFLSEFARLRSRLHVGAVTTAAV